MVELVIQQVTAAFAVIGNKVLVIPGDVDPAYAAAGVRKPTSAPFALVKAEHRLIVEDVGHRPVRRRLARHGAGIGHGGNGRRCAGRRTGCQRGFAGRSPRAAAGGSPDGQRFSGTAAGTRSSPRTAFSAPAGLCARCRRRAADRPDC